MFMRQSAKDPDSRSPFRSWLMLIMPLARPPRNLKATTTKKLSLMNGEIGVWFRCGHKSSYAVLGPGSHVCRWLNWQLSRPSSFPVFEISRFFFHLSGSKSICPARYKFTTNNALNWIAKFHFIVGSCVGVFVGIPAFSSSAKLHNSFVY